MKYQIFYAHDALMELRAIETYLADNFGAITAFNNVNRIITTIESLSDNPHLYHFSLIPALQKAHYRCLPIKNYIIFYRVDENRQLVRVLHIVYGGRDIEHLATEWTHS